MRKITATILSLLILAAIAAPVSAQPALADEGASPLFTSPTDIATAEGYAAVAEGSSLHLFNEKNGGFWQSYAHGRAVVQIDFDEQGTLYFRDANLDLYTLNASTFTAGDGTERIADKCEYFFLNGNALYLANATNTHTLVEEYATKATFLFDRSYGELLFSNDRLYALSDTGGLYELGLTATPQSVSIARFAQPRTGLSAVGSTLFTTGTDGLYAYDLNEGGDTLLDRGSYAALSSRNGKLYAIRNDEVYTLNGTTPVKAAEEFSLPHIERIPAKNLVTDLSSGTFEVVTTTPQALLAAVDLQNADATLPLVRAVRTEAITALKLAETEGYALLSYRASPAEDYQSFVVAKNCYTVSQGERSYAQEEHGYLSSAVSVYQYPNMGLPTLSQASRGEQVSLLGEVTGLDCDYYKIRYGEKIGYIPKAYLLSYEGAPHRAEQTTVGNTGAAKDAVWRMAYILLGTAAIGILVDFLILRKKNEE